MAFRGGKSIPRTAAGDRRPHFVSERRPRSPLPPSSAERRRQRKLHPARANGKGCSRMLAVREIASSKPNRKRPIAMDGVAYAFAGREGGEHSVQGDLLAAGYARVHGHEPPVAVSC